MHLHVPLEGGQLIYFDLDNVAKRLENKYKYQNRPSKEFLQNIRQNNDKEIHHWLIQNILNRCLITI